MISSLSLSPVGIAHGNLSFSTSRATSKQKIRCSNEGGKVVGEENEAMLMKERERRRKWPRKEESSRIIGAAVVEDQVKNARTEEQLRRKARSLGFSFSAAAMLFPYHAGVAKLLIEKDYIKETTPLAGASAGAILSVAIASGISMEDVVRANKTLAQDCRLHGTISRVGGVLEEAIHRLLPNDAHIKSNGRVRIAITQVGPYLELTGLLIDKFESREDLIDALLASSFIPGYVAPRPATVFRNHLCVDGVFTFIIPPTSAAQTIGVCAFPGLMGLQGIGISPDCNPGDRAAVLEYMNWAGWPAANDVIDRHFQSGYSDAAVWVKQNPWEKITNENGHHTETRHGEQQIL